MKFYIIAFLVFFASEINTSQCQVVDQQPQQVHLSLGQDVDQMMVTWITMSATSLPTVEYSADDACQHTDCNTMPELSLKATGHTQVFVDGGSEKRTMYIHRVKLAKLTPGTTYYYHVGSTNGWSSIFWFTTLQNTSDWSPRIAIYGDLGNDNAQSVPRLQREVAEGSFDAIIHVGDMAYNLDTDNARVGDAFLRQLEPIAAYVPYQTVVGNHEAAYNFSNYDARFTMINAADGSQNNHFFSFNIGPIHFISFSTEYYFWPEYGWMQMVNQYMWLQADLIEANKPENRKVRPWIITLGHRPMYCSTEDTDDCKNKESIIRRGLPVLHAFGLEDLFYKHGVDVEIWAHEHTYERMWPVYDYKVYNGSTSKPYTNPTAPIHFITGSAGCNERLDPFSDPKPEWSAVRLSDYGYTRLHAVNTSHLVFEQVSDDQNGKIIDSFTVIKESHGFYPKRPLSSRRKVKDSK